MHTTTEMTADATVATARAKTLLIGGGLLLLGGVLEVIGPFGWGELLATSVLVPRLLVLASAVVFSVGVGAGAALAGTRPLSRIALILLGFSSFVSLMAPDVFMLVVFFGYLVPPVILQPTVIITVAASALLPVAFAVIAGVSIGRARVMPNPWAWVPLPLLVLGVAAGTLQALIYSRLTPLTDPHAGTRLELVHTVIPLILGGLAVAVGLVLARRRAVSSR
ncbi:hypothetical protein PTQ19_14230 [Microbacterium esteraromaticum]|uniref:hypothetical protein n=1 Tax=Microbacterium esteraromaticum TaxID=57043 RepID=UPI002367FBF2|nr:hypothetical protein [Microbacterium esteraromaticum]WDH78654.1 hypothetical protein PTQ19_14230 [Microbacterium esteraromaticum]